MSERDMSTPLESILDSPIAKPVKVAKQNRVTVTEPIPYELYIRWQELSEAWPSDDSVLEDVVAACGFQALELCFRLIKAFLDDPRPEAFVLKRVRRCCEHARRGFEQICAHYQDGGLPSLVSKSVIETRSPGFAILSRLEESQADLLSKHFLECSSRVPFNLGIERQLHEVRDGLKLPAITATNSHERGLFTLDYMRLVKPEYIVALKELDPFGLEDHFFSTAHQMTECWLHITHSALKKLSHWR